MGIFKTIKCITTINNIIKKFDEAKLNNKDKAKEAAEKLSAAINVVDGWLNKADDVLNRLVDRLGK